MTVAIDPAELAERATTAARSLGVATVSEVKPLLGGLSSLTFSAVVQLADRAHERIVLKVAPPGLAPVRNRDVLRQARVLEALAEVQGLAVPRVRFADVGAPPEVPPLFAMELVDGESFEPVGGDHPLPAPDVLAARAIGAARMLARLHHVDPAAVGLGAEPVVTVADEIDRWERALDSLDEELGHTALAAALRAQLPVPAAPAVSHGDWRLGNMLCSGSSISAVIDWEIWSVADPRVDLAWFLATTVHEGNVFAVCDPEGLPPAAALQEAYEDERGAPVEDLGWFQALTSFKQTATMGLIVKHNRRREAPDPAVEASAARLPALVALASDQLEAWQHGGRAGGPGRRSSEEA